MSTASVLSEAIADSQQELSIALVLAVLLASLICYGASGEQNTHYAASKRHTDSWTYTPYSSTCKANVPNNAPNYSNYTNALERTPRSGRENATLGAKVETKSGDGDGLSPLQYTAKGAPPPSQRGTCRGNCISRSYSNSMQQTNPLLQLPYSNLKMNLANYSNAKLVQEARSHLDGIGYSSRQSSNYAMSTSRRYADLQSRMERNAATLLLLQKLIVSSHFGGTCELPVNILKALMVLSFLKRIL